MSEEQKQAKTTNVFEVGKPLELDKRFSGTDKEFLKLFEDTVFAYFDDTKSGKLPSIHSDGLDLTRNNLGYGCFFSVNGIKRTPNQPLTRKKEDVITLNGLFVDFDASNYLGFGNKNFPLQTYKRLVIDELSSIEKPPTALVRTKNGVHAYWLFSRPIFLENMDEEEAKRTRERYERLERSLVEFHMKHLGADPQVKELNRVLRVPGTWHLKDPNDPYAVKLHSVDLTYCYPLEELEEAFLGDNAGGSLETWAESFQDNSFSKEVRDEIEKIYPRLSRPSYAVLLDKDNGAKEGVRNYSLLVVATACRKAGWPLEKTIAHFDKYNGLTLAQIEHDIRTAYKRPEPYDFGYNCPALSPYVTEGERAKYQEAVTVAFRRLAVSEHPTVSPMQVEHEKLLENALDKETQKQRYSIFEFIFQRKYPDLRYEVGGKFFEYKDGCYLQKEEEEVETNMMQEFLLEGLLNFRTRAKVADKIACLKSLPGITFRPEQADPNTSILNVRNGLLDLSTGELSAHTPDYISVSQVSFPFDREADCPRFRQFMNEITLGREDLEILLKKIMGYSLTFDVSHHKAFILHGSGRNGKGVFTNILSQLVGYDFVANLGMRDISSHFGLASLYRKKLNIVDEISTTFFESDMIKKLISGERVMADVKYRNPLVFHPTAKFVFTVNELPRINDQSVGFYERFIVIPFDASFRDNPDTNLGKKLLSEAPGILNYAIEGLKALQSDKAFGKTETTEDAGEEFRLSNSSLLEFLSMYTESGSGRRIPTLAFMRRYQEFCRDFGYKPKSLRSILKEFHFLKSTNPTFASVEAGMKYISSLGWQAEDLTAE